jgi:hypothetical protein
MKHLVTAALTVLVLFVLASVPALAHARTWTLRTVAGMETGEGPVGTVSSMNKVIWGIDPGPYVGPGALVRAFGMQIGKVSHDYGNNRVLSRYVCFLDNTLSFCARPKRVTGDSYVAIGLGVPMRVKLTRNGTGAWRAYLKQGGGDYWQVGTAPRSCPGIYAAGAWYLLCCVLP